MKTKRILTKMIFDHSSYIEIILNKDPCRRYDWKYANVFTSESKGCYKNSRGL